MNSSQEKQISKYCSTSKKWTYTLKHSDIEQIVHLWTRVTQLQDSSMREKGLSKLRSTLASRVGLTTLPTYNLTIPFTEKLPKKAIKQLVRSLIVITDIPLSIADMLIKD